MNELAKLTGYCDDYFRIVFKKKTGMSPKEFILETRLEAAKKMLADKSISLSDIASKCGFEYYSRFSLFFKSKTGATPTEYRKIYLAENHQDPIADQQDSASLQPRKNTK